jgi:hypothetical protein
MFGSNNFYSSLPPMYTGDTHTLRLRGALDHFRQAHFDGWLSKALAALRGRSTGLKDLEQLVAKTRVTSRRYVGLRPVLLDQICGSEGRTRDFDRYFNPLSCHTRQRWLSVMLARLADVPLPPVELIQVGDFYFVRDGHHRLSVAHALGETCIDAEVTVWELAEASVPAPASHRAPARAAL